MSLGTVWTEGVDLLRRHLFALAAIGAIVFVPLDLLVALVDDSRGWDEDVSWSRLGVITALAVVGGTLAYGAAIAAIAVEPEGANEEPRTPLASLRDALVRAGTLLVLIVVATLGVLAGLVLLVVPGLVLFTWWLVAFQAAMVESTGWRGSLARSRTLVRGSFWSMLVLAVALTAVVVAVDYVLWRVGIEALPDLLGAWLSGVIANTVNTAVAAAFVTAAYWELIALTRVEEPGETTA